MPSQLSQAQPLFVSYSAPRVVVGARGRQGRSTTGTINITPGYAQELMIEWGDPDGRALSTAQMLPFIMFFGEDSTFDERSDYTMNQLPPSLLMTKYLESSSTNSGVGSCLLNMVETMLLAQMKAKTWAAGFKSYDGQIFLFNVTDHGAKIGQLIFEKELGFPTIPTSDFQINFMTVLNYAYSSISLVFKQPDGTGVDFTGSIFRMDIKSVGRMETLLSLNEDDGDIVQGEDGLLCFIFRPERLGVLKTGAYVADLVRQLGDNDTIFAFCTIQILDNGMMT